MPLNTPQMSREIFIYLLASFIERELRELPQEMREAVPDPRRAAADRLMNDALELIL